MESMKHMYVPVSHVQPAVAFECGSDYNSEQHLLQVVCCLGQLSFTSCSASGRFLGLSGLRKIIPDLLTASLGHMSEKLVKAASVD